MKTKAWTKAEVEARFRSEATGAALLDAPAGRNDPDDYFIVSRLDLSWLFQRIDEHREQLRQAGIKPAHPPRELEGCRKVVADTAQRLRGPRP